MCDPVDLGAVVDAATVSGALATGVATPGAMSLSKNTIMLNVGH
jgi:hypothetical protein